MIEIDLEKISTVHEKIMGRKGLVKKKILVHDPKKGTYTREVWAKASQETPKEEVRVVGEKEDKKIVTKPLKEIHNTTVKEFTSNYVKNRPKDMGLLEAKNKAVGIHKSKIMSAIKRGLKIPNRVLKDYPYLDKESIKD